MLHLNNDLTLSLLAIFIVIALMVAGIIALIFFFKKKPELKDYLLSLAAGFGLTLIAALAVSFKFDSGAGLARKYGWPHYFYIVWADGTKGWYLGTALSYLLSDIIFFAALALLIMLIIKATEKKRRYY